MSGRRLSLGGWMAWLACGLYAAAAQGGSPEVAQDAVGAGPAAALVQQLGDPRFVTREQASEALLRLGLPAVPALEAGTRHRDREIRFRCQRLLSLVREVDFQQRVAAFAADPHGSDGYGLPGWQQYQQTCGNDPAARALFVEMLQAEPALFAALDSGPQLVGQLINERTEQLRESLRLFHQQLSLGTVASLLFAAGHQDVAFPELTAQTLFSYCYQNAFNAAIEEGGRRDLLRKILGQWVRKGEGWGAYQGMMLAVRYQLKEGLVPAVTVLENPVASTNVRQLAILTIASFGDQSHFPLLESLLADTTECGGEQNYRTQMRDVALAALVCLAGQDPKTSGFPRYRPHDEYLITTDSLGFATEAERQQAIEQWRRFRQRSTAPAQTR